jgi:hypothetical protein
MFEMLAQNGKNMMEMMKALQMQNTLALLPPEERAQFMIADRMASLLEGGHMVPFQAPAIAAPATEQTPGLHALTYSPPEMSYAQAKALLAAQEAENNAQRRTEEVMEKAREILKHKNKVPARVASAFGPLALEDIQRGPSAETHVP